MRQGLSALLLALLPCLMASPTSAEESTMSVMAIDDLLFSHHTQLQQAIKATQQQQDKVDSQQTELSRLNILARDLESRMLEAKLNLEQSYLKMIDEPQLDLTTVKNAYQQVWSAVKENQQEILQVTQELQEKKSQLEQLKTKQNAIQQKIEQLDQNKLRARAERLRSELRNAGEQKVSFTNHCQPSMTISECQQQTLELAKQKSAHQFQQSLVKDLSESSQVSQSIDDVSLNIHLLQHQVVSSGFHEDNRFQLVLNTRFEARPAENAPCRLLNIDSQYCFAPSDGSFPSQQQEIAWVNLTLRSNQHDDRVVINNVNYGSTPVEVMLPRGNHQVRVYKDGFHDFNQQLKIQNDQTVRVVLREIIREKKAGDKFADTLKNAQPAPQMITLLAGEYLLGENTARQVRLDHAFAISATPITIDQFEHFVKQTDYKTDAELKNICLAVQGASVTPVSGKYWRNPGFQQHAQSPAVCISRNDAYAYTNWLTKQTGFNYRLPTENEWEVAARAGNRSDYWWGNDFGTSRANTGWSGTPWSNQSTSPVQAFSPNPLGFYDMVGNVWQWTSDAPGIAKGGAWSFSPDMAKAYNQLFVAPATAANYLGFRVLREL